MAISKSLKKITEFSSAVLKFRYGSKFVFRSNFTTISILSNRNWGQKKSLNPYQNLYSRAALEIELENLEQQSDKRLENAKSKIENLMNFDELIKNVNGTNTEDINELSEISVKVDNYSKK